MARCSYEALGTNSYNESEWRAHAIPELDARNQLTAFVRQHSTLPKRSKTGIEYKIAEVGGQNIEFDIGFLKKLYEREFFPMSLSHRDWFDTIDLARAANFVCGIHFDSYKLGDMCKQLGIDSEPTHDALADIRATVALARELRRILRNEEQDETGEDLLSGFGNR